VWPWPADASFTEEELVGTAGERELLEGFLGYHRQVVRGKVRGLSEEDARRLPGAVVHHATSA